jgi:hypothetical protein
MRFGDLAHKITAMIFWFVLQNQVRYGLSVATQNRWGDEDDAGHTLRSSGLLRLEASQARVSQSSLKISRGTTQMVHVASSRRSQPPLLLILIINHDSWSALGSVITSTIDRVEDPNLHPARGRVGFNKDHCSSCVDQGRNSLPSSYFIILPIFTWRSDQMSR